MDQHQNSNLVVITDCNIIYNILEHEANARNENKKDKQMIEELETEMEDLAETLCISKIIICSTVILSCANKSHSSQLCVQHSIELYCLTYANECIERSFICTAEKDMTTWLIITVIWYMNFHVFTCILHLLQV